MSVANILIHGKQVKFVCQKKKLDLGYQIVIQSSPKLPRLSDYRKLPKINARTE